MTNPLLVEKRNVLGFSPWLEACEGGSGTGVGGRLLGFTSTGDMVKGRGGMGDEGSSSGSEDLNQ